MLFTLIKASNVWDESGAEPIEVKTIEDLKQVSEEHESHDLIVDFEKNEIWIYDDYMES